MATKTVDDDNLFNLANSIRLKGNISGSMKFPDGFITSINKMAELSSSYSGTIPKVESDRINSVSILVGGLNKIQMIHICRLDDGEVCDQQTVDSLTIIMSSDGNTIEARSIASTNLKYKGSNWYDTLNNTDGISVVVNTSNIQITSDEDYEIYFFGRYRYFVYGI